MKRLILAFLFLSVATSALALTAVWTRPTQWADNVALTPEESARVVVRVYRATNPSGTFSLQATGAPGADNAALPSVTRGTMYYYKADACIDSLCSDNSALVGYINLTGPMPPGGVLIIPR